MTFKYKNVYLNDSALAVGPYEAMGPLGDYFDKSYTDLYFGEKSWEKAEVRLIKDSLDILLEKTKLKKENIDTVISGDLLNQVTASTYGTSSYGNSFLGVYTACASSCEALIIGASLIDSKRINNCICTVSSHNMSSEKQFRNPTEYGAPKPLTSTFTATGAASVLLSNKKGKVKIESSTIGKIIDYGQNDPNHMGAVMAPAAAYVINKHLTDLNRKPDYYDLILTGDLGKYGVEILKDLMEQEYKTDISKNYNDCGVMLYDTRTQKEIHAGGSGPVCSALVNFGYVLESMRKGKLKKVLIVATGALFSPTFVFQKENILSIANAVSLEVA